jgi:hypothetical protein
MAYRRSTIAMRGVSVFRVRREPARNSEHSQRKSVTIRAMSPIFEFFTASVSVAFKNHEW